MNIVIIEDEALAAKKLEHMLSEITTEVSVAATLESIEDAVSWFESNLHPDLIFMDIQLEDGLSFDILNRVDIDCPIIFTTAYDQYALQAFKSKSIDYLLKPIGMEDLNRAFIKYRDIYGNQKSFLYMKEEIRSLGHLLQSNQKIYKNRFLVQLGNKLHSISTTDIAYFKSEDRTILLVTKDNHRFPLDRTLDAIEAELNPIQFSRANRQFIIQIDSISKIEPHFKGRLKLTLKPGRDVDLVISSDKSRHMRKWLDL